MLPDRAAGASRTDPGSPALLTFGLQAGVICPQAISAQSLVGERAGFRRGQRRVRSKRSELVREPWAVGFGWSPSEGVAVWVFDQQSASRNAIDERGRGA